MHSINTSLYSVFLKHLYQTPNKIYLHSKHGKITYKQSSHIINSFSEIMNKGLHNQKNKIITASFTNPDILFFIIWACVQADISLVLFPPIKDIAYIKEIMKATGASILLSDIEELNSISMKPSFEDALKKALNLHIEFSCQQKVVLENKAAFIFHTSGTTGTPKLVKVAYSKFIKSLNCIFENKFMQYTIDQTVYIVPPLFHSYGLSSMFEYTMGGSAIKLPGEISYFSPIKELARKDSETKITAIEGVPYFYQQISLLLPKLQLQDLNHIGFGGDAVNPDVFEKFKEKYDGVSFSIRYGLTETPSVVSLNVLKPPYKSPKNCGRILPIYQVKTKNADSSAKEGEILIKGQCLGSYISNSELNTDWFETGDFGYSEQNMLFIIGRKSAFIKNSGFRLSPIMIESIICGYEGIKDCIVYSLNEKLTASIMVENQQTFEKHKLLKILHEKLPEFYVPKRIVFTNKIPRTSSGKIIRNDYSENK